MAKNIEPKLRKIGSYLQLEEDTIFVIPEYQRPYSWGITNCDKLWQDIIDYNDGDSKDNYFFGTIIINCDNDDTVYSLIDGQQRTTTFLLLLKALLIRINIAINNTANDEDSKPLFRGLKDRRRRIMELLYKVEADDIPEEFDKVADSGICQSIVTIPDESHLLRNYTEQIYFGLLIDARNRTLDFLSRNVSAIMYHNALEKVDIPLDAPLRVVEW